MWKRCWKKYWKIVAAAVFLTAAGFCYGGSRLKAGEIRLEKREPLTDNGTGAAAEAAENAVKSSPRAEEQNATDPETVPESRENGYFVHICGQVKNPGVYELGKDCRIFEAVEAAGGFTDDAAEELLNLAEKISDGMKIVVLSREEAEALTAEEKKTVSGMGAQTGSVAGEKSRLININTASKEELMTLSGIGESRAEDIIRYREESGGFQKIEDIMKVPGIKNAGFQKIKDRITV